MREPALDKDYAQSFPLIHGRIRRLVLSRFPYAVYFREQGAEILVIALRGRQNPDRWQHLAHHALPGSNSLSRGRGHSDSEMPQRAEKV
jgi:hypothetical protein